MRKRSFQVMTLFLAVIAVGGMVFLFNPAPVRAAGLQLSTRYPGITVMPGEHLSFNLEIENGLASQAFNLNVKNKPEGWQTVFKGNGRVIHEVFVGGNSRGRATLNVDMPGDVSPGTYSILVQATGESYGSDKLQLEVRVSEESAGNDELATQYSELKGPADANFKFRVDLSNNGTGNRSYSLGAKAPEGWQVSFSPSYKDQQIASMSVDAGATEGINVSITPPAKVKAGEYNIPVYAISGNKKVSTTLKVIISGSYDLKFSTPSGRLSADIVAGGEKDVTMEVTNNGSSELHNISLTSREPRDWSVQFDPGTIDALKPGESRQVIATLKAGDKAIAGDYVVSLNAESAEARDSADLRVTVKTSTWWGIVGLLVILLVIAGVYRAFRIYGRR